MNSYELSVLCLSLLLAVPFVGAFCVYISNKAKDYIAMAFGCIEFAVAVLALLSFRNETALVNVPEIVYLGLDFAFDGFRCLYTAVATFMWMISIIFSKEYMHGEHKVQRFYFFTLLTLFATVGVLLSNSLYTTFIFFEVMSFTSYVWVAQEEEKPALRAADTYLAVAVIGGLVMLMGISMLYYMNGGSVLFADLADFITKADNKTAVYAAGFMCLFGFGAKQVCSRFTSGFLKHTLLLLHLQVHFFPVCLQKQVSTASLCFQAMFLPKIPFGARLYLSLEPLPCSLEHL